MKLLTRPDLIAGVILVKYFCRWQITLPAFLFSPVTLVYYWRMVLLMVASETGTQEVAGAAMDDSKKVLPIGGTFAWSIPRHRLPIL